MSIATTVPPTPQRIKSSSVMQPALTGFTMSRISSLRARKSHPHNHTHAAIISYPATLRALAAKPTDRLADTHIDRHAHTHTHTQAAHVGCTYRTSSTLTLPENSASCAAESAAAVAAAAAASSWLAAAETVAESAVVASETRSRMPATTSRKKNWISKACRSPLSPTGAVAVEQTHQNEAVSKGECVHDV